MSRWKANWTKHRTRHKEKDSGQSSTGWSAKAVVLFLCGSEGEILNGQHAQPVVPGIGKGGMRLLADP